MTPPLNRYPEQDADADWMAARDQALLLLDPRVGKTPVSLVAAIRAGAKKILMLTRAINRENMRRHARIWAPEAEFEVESYERASRNPARFEELKRFRPDVLLVDEGQQAKNPVAKRTKMLYGPYFDGRGGLTENIGRLGVLSGTLCPNHLGEAWTHLRRFGRTDRRYRSFLDYYCEVWQSPYGPVVKGVREEHLDEFRAMIRPITLRRRFSEVFPHLPKAAWTTIPLELDASHRRELARLEGDVKVLQMRTELRAARTEEEREAILARAEPATASLRKLLAQVKAGLVAEQVMDLLESGIHKIVVFAWHPDMLTAMRKALHAYGPVQVDGSVPEAARWAAIDRFQENSDTRVFLGQIDTAGEGIDLYAARHIVLAEYAWSLGKMLQAVQRIANPNRLDKPEILACTVAGTIDDDLEEALRRKIEHHHVFNTL